MIATTEEALADLFATAILAIQPRITFKGAETWKHYDQETDSATRTRRFRFVWSQAELLARGDRAGHIFEHAAELRIRTDYAGDHARIQYVIIDDGVQLRDVLSGLSNAANGLVLVEALGFVRESQVADVIKVDHRFRVRYLRTVRP